MYVVSAVGLYILVSLFSSGTESNARWKILFIAVASAIVQASLANALPNVLGLALAIVASLALIWVALVFWCDVDKPAAVKIAASYFGLCIAIAIIFFLIAALSHKL